MIPPAQSWDIERTVALLALDNHSNGTDSDMTSVRITTAVSKMIDLSLYNDGVPWLTLPTGPQIPHFSGVAYFGSGPRGGLFLKKNPFRHGPAGIANLGSPDACHRTDHDSPAAYLRRACGRRARRAAGAAAA